MAHTNTRILALLAAFTITPAQADDLILHGVSAHIDDDYEYNEQNGGIGVRIDTPELVCESAIVGTYRNSIDHQSVYAACDEHIGSAGRLDLSVQLGAVSGYDTDWPVVPLVTATARIDIPGPVNPTFTYMPDQEGGSLLLSVSIPFN